MIEETAVDSGVEPGQPPVYRRLFSSAYFRNNILVLGAGLLLGLLNYAQHPLLVRTIGLIEYKTVISLVALSTVFLIPTQILSTIATRYAATLSADGNTAQLNDLVQRLTGIMLGVGAVFALVFIAASAPIAAFLHIGTVQPVIIIGIGFIVAFASPVNTAVLQGLQNFSWAAPLSVLPLVLRLVLIIVLVRAGLQIEGAMLAITASGIISYLVSFYPLRPLLRGRRLPIGSLRPLLSYSITAILAAAGNALMFQVDIVLAGHFLPPLQAALYAVVATLGKMVLFIGSNLTTVLFPRAAALHQRGEDTVRVVMQSFIVMFALSAIVEVVFVGEAGRIVHALYGPQAMAATGQLPWYGLAMLLFAPTQALMTYFLAVNERMFTIVVLACSLLQGALIVLRHQTIGEIVQAVVISIAWLLVMLLALFVARTRHPRKQPLHAI